MSLRFKRLGVPQEYQAYAAHFAHVAKTTWGWDDKRIDEMIRAAAVPGATLADVERFVQGRGIAADEIEVAKSWHSYADGGGDLSTPRDPVAEQRQSDIDLLREAAKSDPSIADDPRYAVVMQELLDAELGTAEPTPAPVSSPVRSHAELREMQRANPDLTDDPKFAAEMRMAIDAALPGGTSDSP